MGCFQSIFSVKVRGGWLPLILSQHDRVRQLQIRTEMFSEVEKPDFIESFDQTFHSYLTM